MQHKLLSVFGTRPEAIKMAPLLSRLSADSSFDSSICLTRQHNDLVDPLMDYFGLEPDIRLPTTRRKNRNLNSLVADILLTLDPVMREQQPDLVLVHGDTSSCLAGALTAFHLGIPVAHVEAGLRTHNPDSPHPEELNRSLVGRLASLHFAPTTTAVENLLAENISPNGIFMTGSTIVDALLDTVAKNRMLAPEDWIARLGTDISQALHDDATPVILVTSHRRENLSTRLDFICRQLRLLAIKHPDWRIIFPVHLNPIVHEKVTRQLGGIPNIDLLKPLNYPDFVEVMSCCDLIITDSGGIQEEAPYLGKSVLVARENTERPEGFQAGVQMSSFSPEEFRTQVEHLLDEACNGKAESTNLYGDGTASVRIVEEITAFFKQSSKLLAAS